MSTPGDSMDLGPEERTAEGGKGGKGGKGKVKVSRRK